MSGKKVKLEVQDDLVEDKPRDPKKTKVWAEKIKKRFCWLCGQSHKDTQPCE